MITTNVTKDTWRQVDEGWGRQVATFASLSEPGNCREYVALHHELAVDTGDRLLDVACGAGLALELAALRGAVCAGIDALPRLLAVAKDRSPGADLRVGDMCAMPWDDASFDVVTSFRGIWGTTPDAVAEVFRVLAPGGRVGITVWGHLKASLGAWALSPFRLASEPKVANQAAMVSLGRPGAGEDLLTRCGFADVRRVEIPFAWEFPDPETYARALASSGPAYEAIQAVGEEAFLEHATDVARERERDGLPLRAEIKVVGYLARKPAASRLPEPPRRAEPGRVRRGTGLDARGGAAVRGRHGRQRLRHEHHPDVRPSTGHPRQSVRSADASAPSSLAQHSAAGGSDRGDGLDARRLLLLPGLGRAPGPPGYPRPHRGADPWRRQRMDRGRAGARGLGPEGRP